MSSEPLLQVRGKDWECLSKFSFDHQIKDKGPQVEPLSKETNERQKEKVTVVEPRWRRTWLVRWGQRRVVDPFLTILRRGLEPKLLSLSAALGLTLGLFPVYGVTIVLCVVAAAILRSKCNVPTLMLANFVATPLELGLIVPFLRVGELVTGGKHFPLSSSALWKAITGHGSSDVLLGLTHALVGWAIFAPFLLPLLYLLFLPVFRCLIRRFGTDQMLQPQLPVYHQTFTPSGMLPSLVEHDRVYHVIAN